MAAAVDVLQQFANDDLFDAELGADSDGGQNGNLSEEDSPPKSPAHDWIDKQKDNNSDGEAANSSSDEETTLERRKKQKKRDAKKKSPKPRKAKKAELLSMRSETQRMIREKTIRLPYHQPTALPISHFLKRVPITDHKETKSRITKTAEKVVPSDIPHDDESTPGNISKPDEHDSTSPLPGDTASPTGVVKDVQGFKAATPKLSAATDPFFLDVDMSATSLSKPVNSGVQSLRDRFLKHTSKPQDKSAKPAQLRERKCNETLTETTPKPVEGTLIVSDDKVKAATPGARLQILKEQLQAKMRVKRAENRKIQESQQKLDNEEISEEEEEEEEMTDEEEDSDYELDQWNQDDERKQQEGESDLDEEPKEKNAFVEDEAEESDNNDDNNGYDIDSGSEGDISDGGESDISDEKSVFSDDGLSKRAAKLKSKKKHNESKKLTLNIEDATMDLFCDSRSRCDTKGDSNDSVPKNNKTEKDSEESAASLSLRLDSVEDGDESNFSFPSLPASSKRKTNVSSKVVKSLMNISEVSQESSQSSFGDALGSEFGEISANSLEASSDSSRIPPGQGESNAQGNEEKHSGKKTPELFSSFSKLRNLIGITTNGDAQSTKKPGKLSQLTLPIEDSQDLFDDESDRNTQDNFKQDGNRTEASSSDFHFTLDEDTQFTQILNTQGFINSSKKSKSKTNQLFDDEKNSDTQPEIKELLGLCSGRFSDSEDSKMSKSAKPLDKTKKYQKGGLFDTQGREHNMDELLGLCTGKFNNDENEGEDDDLGGGEKDGRDVGLEEQEENRSEEEKVENTTEAKSEKGDGSDPEEMILKRKFGKKYEAKKSIFDKRNFLEEEAELSGSDVGSDEDEDIATDDDVLEEDSGGEELPSDEELQKQINKVHMKSIHDQDNADLRAVKEMFLPDGDLHTDGQGRTRHFRWWGIDENSQLSLFGNKEMWGEEEGMATELSTEEEIQRRKERYEREAFLRDEMSKQKSVNVLDIDESSQDILSKIKDTSSQLSEAPLAPSKPQAIIDPKSCVAPVLKKKTSFKGSFLKHNKTTLSRLSSLTSNTPNASATTRGFVFQTVKPSGKNTINTKKMQRTNSVIEQPASKKPRLERSLSDSNQSVFSML